jgi:transcriptional regulator with XRE-family HTH domain
MSKKVKTSTNILERLRNISPLIRKRVKRKMEIAIRIKEVLNAKGWTQKDLAEKMEKRESEISRFLSGNHNMTLDTLFALEEILETDIIQIANPTSYYPIETDEFGGWSANEPEGPPYGQQPE